MSECKFKSTSFFSCHFFFTSKFLRAMKYCGVSGKNINNTRNTIGIGEKIFGTIWYGKYVPAMKPSKIPIVTLSISSEPRRPRILQFIYNVIVCIRAINFRLKCISS